MLVSLMMILVELAAAAPPAEDVFYDTLWIMDDCLFSNAIGNALSGRGVLGSLYDLRLTDDFDLERAAVIESVAADYLTFLGRRPGDGVFVRVYADANGRPSEPPLFQTLATQVETEDLGQQCGWHQLFYLRVTVRGLSIVLPAGRFWICIQPADTTVHGDWYWQFGLGESESPGREGQGASAHVRDGDLGEGAWGHQDWRSTQEEGFGVFTTSMQVAGHWATVCDRIESLSAICRNERLRVAVESRLPEGKKLTIVNGQQERRMTIRKAGRGRVHFDRQTTGGEVAIEGCEEWTRTFDCPG